MGNPFHKSEIFHSLQKMYQCEPFVHLYPDEDLQKKKTLVLYSPIYNLFSIQDNINFLDISVFVI